METLIGILATDEDSKCKMFIEKVKKNEEIKAKDHSKRSKYVNPGALRSGIKPETIFFSLKRTECCPV